MLADIVHLNGWIDAQVAHTIGLFAAALLTCAVLSYVFGDNPLFRLAEYLLVGVAAGYAAALAWRQVLAPRLQALIGDPASYWYYGIFFILGVLLLCRGWRPLSVLGNLPLGVLFGAGAALALGGALTGSLVPQLQAIVVSVAPVDYGGGAVGWALAIDAFLLVVGTLAVLSAFNFSVTNGSRLGAAWQRFMQGLGGLGRALLMVTFGAVFAGALLSFFAILIGRIDFLARFITELLPSLGWGA